MDTLLPEVSFVARRTELPTLTACWQRYGWDFPRRHLPVDDVLVHAIYQ